MKQYLLFGFGLVVNIGFAKAEACHQSGMTGLVTPTGHKGQTIVGFWNQTKNVRVGPRRERHSVILMEAVTQLENGDIITSPEPVVLISEKFSNFYHYTVDFVDRSTLVIEVHTQLPGKSVGGFDQFRFDTSITPPKLIHRYSGNSTTYAMVTFADTDGELVRCGERRPGAIGAKSCFKFDSAAGVYNPWSKGMNYDRHMLYSRFVKVGRHQCVFGSFHKSKVECIDPAKNPLEWYYPGVETFVHRFRSSVTKDNEIYMLPYHIGGPNHFEMDKLKVEGNSLIQDQYDQYDLGLTRKNSRTFLLFNGEKTIIVRDDLGKSTFMWDVDTLGPRVNLTLSNWMYSFSMDQRSSTDTKPTCDCPILARPPGDCRYRIEYDSNNCPVKWNLICDDCEGAMATTISAFNK